MITTPHMGLTLWNLALDHFNKSQHNDNLLKIASHDHTAGRGPQIPTGGLEDGAVTIDKLATGAVVEPIEPTLAGTWTDGYTLAFAGGAAHLPPSYSKAFGRVYIDGAATRPGGAPAAGTLIFTLPVGFRPAEPVELHIGMVGTAEVAIINVLTNGEVLFISSSSNTVFFNGVSFPVA